MPAHNVLPGETNNATVGKYASAGSNGSTSATLLLSAFSSPIADLHAVVNLSLDVHRLRVLDGNTGALKAELDSAPKSGFSSLTWGVLAGQTTETSKGKKRRQSGQALPSTTQVLVLGTEDGQIKAFSPSHNTVLCTLVGAHQAPIRDALFTSDGTMAFSADASGLIIQWDLGSGTEMKRFTSRMRTISRLAYAAGPRLLFVADHRIEAWAVEDGHLVTSLPGHATSVVDLALSSTLPQEDGGLFLVSAADQDRSISMWNLGPLLTALSQEDGEDEAMGLPTLDSAQIPVSLLTLEHPVTRISISEANYLLASTHEGLAAVWRHPFVVEEEKSKKKKPRSKAAFSRPADSIIHLTQTGGKKGGKTMVPLLEARWILGSENTARVRVACGSSSLLSSYQAVDLLDTDRGGEMKKEVVVEVGPQDKNLLLNTQDLVSRRKEASENRALTSRDESAVRVLGAEDTVPQATSTMNDQGFEPTMEEQLKMLALSKAAASSKKASSTGRTLNSAASTPAATPKANSLQQILVQSLRSGDRALLGTCLVYGNQQLVHNTVRRLPAELAAPLLECLVDRFRSRPADGLTVSVWIKSVLLYHSARLMSDPSMVSRLATLYQAIDARTFVQPRLLRLSGRLDMALEQIRMRSVLEGSADGQDGTPGNVYVEGEEEEDEEGSDEDDDDSDEEEDYEDDEDSEDDDEDDQLAEMNQLMDMDGEEEEEEEEEDMMLMSDNSMGEEDSGEESA
ncbi:hypothetical protein BJ684DRAFT_15082 [Piptocephalis cylindrospora]|uniref:Small-subunit processome Utp12 domain-containing protein n=1 Tax=Piptocephalis cylindrospora TaxID=1907219 RepID=A0A4P9Y7A3_9FUNG|nr:hypothetical protein BJ684DRAFT_15082 [Piptocephalis cylindrospora]|eukprot:RKP14594.1 hypothetical protein BJ684DRAFT_15082 [Piptocephalis cylindrospora]